jgi:hypothetical protein
MFKLDGTKMACIEVHDNDGAALFVGSGLSITPLHRHKDT